MTEEQKFQIFTGVAVPVAKRGNLKPRESKYPFAEMDIGDFFIVPDKSSKSFGPTVRAAATRLGVTFTVRSGPAVDAEGTEIIAAGSIGVWRVEARPPRVKKEKAAA